MLLYYLYIKPPFFSYCSSSHPLKLEETKTLVSVLKLYPKMTIIEMRVHMDCAGCETKIKKALQKLDGVDDIDINMAMQKVTVMGWADQKKILKAVRKTGRRAELWPYPYNPEYYNFNQQYYYQQQQGTQPAEAITYYAPQYSTSSYNYRKHGYSNEDYGYYQKPPYSVVDEQTSALFSDENPHACSIM